MLIILPPSELKAPPPERGRPVALDDLSFPKLTPVRARVVEALIATSARPDALRRLQVGPFLTDEVERNTRLLALPARPAMETYTGPLHEGLDAATLSPAASKRASRDLVIVSALWGALRPVDRIPSYRLHVCAHLYGLDRLEPTWRTVLSDVLGEAAGRQGVVLDLRSPSYRAVGTPSGADGRTVTLRVRHQDVTRRLGDVVAKRVRGQVARYLLESGADVDDPGSLADVLGEGWEARLEPSVRPGSQRTITVSVQPGDT